jgi:hypothetical protein
MNYDLKKGHESNYQFDFQPLKVGNCPYLLAAYCWKDFDEFYNFVSYLTSIGDMQKKSYEPSKLQKSPFREFRDSHLGSLRKK